MKVLILGSNGNLAQAFARVYHDAQVVGWDRDELDITEESQVLEKITALKPDLVINCAAYNAVDEAETDRKSAELLNGYAPGFIAKACKQLEITFVHYSTGQVFDGKKAEGYTEDALPDPVNAYGQSKLVGEMEVQNNMDKFYIIRTAWLFGNFAKNSVGNKKSFIDIMLKLADGEEPIKAIEDEFGTPTYVYDLAQASRALVEEHKAFGIYHLVNSGMASRLDWAREIFRIKNLNPDIFGVSSSQFERPAARPKYELLKNTKFIELRPWSEALKEFLISN
ncbi:MAG TPA: dTDP-4-dehydrorhamnose reductase [Patescibacteria group bacterium]|nr:dTDP-4-dehydrorhamnose reductase [Patescibacteria group bacterium]